MKLPFILFSYILTIHSLLSQNIDPNYPEIDKFIKAGRLGGIPYLTKIKSIIQPGDNIQNHINQKGQGVILLKAGSYVISQTIQMADGVVLRGIEKSEVKLSITMKSGAAIKFPSDTKNSGLENLRLVYEALPNPPKEFRSGLIDGAFCRECFENDYPDFDNTLIEIRGNNNWLDNIEAINSGSDPIEIYGDHNTIRNSLIDNCYNKGGGGEGYFDIRGESNLITGCTVKRIRHFAIQQGARYNVIYKNRIEGDVNYHNRDGGQNLVEQNEIIRPSWHTWGVFATGGARFGHSPPGPRNIIFNNTTFDHRERKTEFSVPGVIYTYRDYGEPSATNWAQPNTGTFYPKNHLNYSDWISGMFEAANKNANAQLMEKDRDPDQDGLSNIIEYALNLHPLQKDSSIFNFKTSSPSTQFIKPIEREGVTTVIETSRNLAKWKKSVTFSNEADPEINTGYRISEDIDSNRLLLHSQRNRPDLFFRIKVTD